MSDKENHARYSVQLGWEEFERCGDISNYAEVTLDACEYYRIERDKLQKENSKLTEIAAKHATRADELYDALERVCSYLSEDGLTTTGLTKEIVNAQAILRKTHCNAPD